MNAADIGYLAGICAIVSTFVALLDARKRRRTRLSEEEARAERGPVELDNIVLGNAREAMLLQSGVVSTLRTELDASKALVAERDKRIVDLLVEITLYEKRYREVVMQLGEAAMKIQGLEKER